ncbi:MAG: hypothetical protein AB7F25_13550 [Deferribacterales bacterium]
MIYSQNALDPTENISYAEGRVTKTNHSANTVEVTVDNAVYGGLPIEYESVEARPESYAFSVNDPVVVRQYKGVPSHITGFKDRLWPFVPMPAEAYETDNFILSSGLLHRTEFVRSPKAAFNTAYEAMKKKTCAVSTPTYINQPAPDDTNGKIYSLQVHQTTNVYTRLTRYYFGSEFIYETYNEETTSGVFNGTRSNVITAHVDPISGAAFMIYQVNTFTDWKPQTSGRVDFDFYLYSSLGIHEKIASAYALITGASSPVYGECIGYDTTGFYCEDTADTGFFISGFYTCAVNPFTADSGVNTVSQGEYLKYGRFIQSWAPDGYGTSVSDYNCDENGNIELAAGLYVSPDGNIYKKKR